MQHQLSLEAAVGCMELIKESCINGDYKAFGVHEHEMSILTKPGPWIKDDHNTVRRTLESIIFGVMETAQLPRFQPPAEYTATVLAIFVSGANMMPACHLVSGGARAHELAAGVRNAETQTPEQLFSFIAMIRGDDQKCKPAFQKAVAHALSRADNQETAAAGGKRKA